MRTVFLDTVGMIALWNEKDQWHGPATAAFALLDASATRFVTTSYVLLECANQAARWPYRKDVVRVREDLGLAGDLFEPTAAEIAKAWNDYELGAVGSAGVVDLVSFAVMRRLAITEAFTNDKHFAAAGFQVLF
jgi:predicted nucleic acid-binding protein